VILQISASTALAMDSSADYASPPPLALASAVQQSQPSNAAVIRHRHFVAVAILLLVNLLNYMDRFTVSGVLTQLQDYFDMNDSEAGLLQVSKENRNV